ncbi:VTT domain-containing protein [Plasmodiophora brassicae]|uniref:VTT domain-containing protein n=1 Tax=Plasmodiophora brassicae TaxID=37360 RepID=A0A0G4IVJ7_PLABS|nr:hypothetical protein PBRA_001044 [Plasmodiophora brassicae]SPQ97155.1 unnamed protein product [Plasmodiophora brassicae]
MAAGAAVVAGAAVGVVYLLSKVLLVLLAHLEERRFYGLGDSTGGIALEVVGYCLFYIVFAACCLPTSLLATTGGFIFCFELGVAVGIPVALLATFLSQYVSTFLSFMLARRFLSSYIQARVIAPSPKYVELQRAIVDQGFRILVLLRMSPVVPQSVLSYVAGTTTMPAKVFLLASVGLLPECAVFTFVGSTLDSLSQISSGRHSASPIGQAFMYAGTVCLVASAAYIVFLIRKRLRAITDARNDAGSYRRVSAASVEISYIPTIAGDDDDESAAR